LTEKNNLYGRYEKKLHYISNQEIEALAYGLIHRFNRDILKTPQPTPIDDILEFQIKEKHKIDFNIEDLIKKYPEQEVLGYFDIYGKKIVIDKTLYEDTSEIGERRCSFTISHEIGHYMVQGMRVEGHIRQMDLFEKPLKQEEDIICTCTGTTKEKVQQLVNNGADSIDKISSTTGANTGCGSCDVLILELLEK